MKKKLDVDVAMGDFIAAYGVRETLAAFCRQCNDMGMPVLFRKLNRVYEWLMTP